jgi:hypothetical protein
MAVSQLSHFQKVWRLFSFGSRFGQHRVVGVANLRTSPRKKIGPKLSGIGHRPALIFFSRSPAHEKSLGNICKRFITCVHNQKRRDYVEEPMLTILNEVLVDARCIVVNTLIGDLVYQEKFRAEYGECRNCYLSWLLAGRHRGRAAAPTVEDDGFAGVLAAARGEV